MKNKIAVLSQRKENRILKRGDVYYADLCGVEQSLGSEQTGRRPVLVIQNDVGNLISAYRTYKINTYFYSKCIW